MLAWGCNAKVNVPPRFKNSGKHKLTYKHATAMEVLVGIFLLTGQIYASAALPEWAT